MSECDLLSCVRNFKAKCVCERGIINKKTFINPLLSDLGVFVNV